MVYKKDDGSYGARKLMSVDPKVFGAISVGVEYNTTYIMGSWAYKGLLLCTK